MQPNIFTLPGSPAALVQVRQESSGPFIAEVIGLPELHATGASAEEAVAQVRDRLTQWLAAGRLVFLTVPSMPPLKKPTGWAKNDQLEQEFLEDLARMRQEDLERTLREDEQGDAGCSNTSSTPTT